MKHLALRNTEQHYPKDQIKFFAQLVTHMLFLVILCIYWEDPWNLRMQNEKNHVDSDLIDIQKEKSMYFDFL